MRALGQHQARNSCLLAVANAADLRSVEREFPDVPKIK